MSIATVITLGYGSFGDVPHVITVGYDLGSPVIVVIDTHDGGRKRREAFRKQNEERKEDLIRAFARVTGIDLAPQSEAEEVIEAVEERIIKPKRPRERDVLRMAKALRGEMSAYEAFQRAELEREAEEEDLVIMSLSRVLH